ncbi:MAG: diaminopimelate epimerase, partial [Acidobacteria bacterium]|nr:diaminopimelate epimerase [Acidobacteriota bacterium]
MGKMKVSKLHGLGNDFLIAASEEIGLPGVSFGSLAESWCRRRTGIGADGVIFYQPTVGDPEADVSALIFNADGSRAEMSGNGTRCLAAWLLHSGILDAPQIRIRTVSGVKSFVLRGRDGRTFVFESTLGVPVTEPSRIPVLLEAQSQPLIGYPLAVDTGVVRVTVTSMGNPHCSTFWPEVSEAPVDMLGPALERHPCFPNRTNVEFVQVLDRHNIRVRFWERGVGPTLASGTGSCAAAVAAMLNRLADSPVRVEVVEGSMMVQWQPPGELSLTGPAEYICSVEFP